MLGLDPPRQQTGRNTAKDFSLRWADLLKGCLPQPNDSTQQEYSLHSYLWCFTEALKLEGMNQGLDFWVSQFWQVPLYIAGNVPKVIASASLHKKLLSLKIKTNFSLDLILENPSLQHFDVLNYGMPWKKHPKLLLKIVVQGLWQPVILFFPSETSSHPENRKLWLPTLSKMVWFQILHKGMACLGIG